MEVRSMLRPAGREASDRLGSDSRGLVTALRCPAMPAGIPRLARLPAVLISRLELGSGVAGHPRFKFPGRHAFSIGVEYRGRWNGPCLSKNGIGTMEGEGKFDRPELLSHS